MPLTDLPNRTRYEDELAERIAALLLAFRRGVESGGAVDYASFAARLADELRIGLHPAFVEAANALAAAELGGELVQASDAAEAYAIAAAAIVARQMTDTTINGVAGAADRQGSIAQLFARERAVNAAVTEITRAISAGESFAARQVSLLTGRVASWVWRVEDSEACPVCTRLNGQRNPPIVPPAHNHCRCRQDYSFSVLPVGAGVLAGGGV